MKHNNFQHNEHTPNLVNSQPTDKQCKLPNRIIQNA